MLVNLIKLSEMIHDEEIISLANEVASEEESHYLKRPAPQVQQPEADQQHEHGR